MLHKVNGFTMALKRKKEPSDQLINTSYNEKSKSSISITTDTLNLISDFIIIIDSTAKILWSNNSFKNSLANQKVNSFREIIFKTDIEDFNSFISNNHDIKIRIKQDNNPSWINWKKQHFEYNGEKAFLLIGKKHSLINENEEYYNELAQIASFGYCEYSTTENVIYLNASISKILGLPLNRKELHIEDYIKMVHPVDNLKFINWLNHSNTKKEFHSTEYRIINNQDKIRYLKSYVKNIYDGQLNRRMVFIHDITDLKKSINSLKYSEYRLRSIFDNAPIGIVYITSNGEILDINPAGLQILGSPSKKETTKINFLNFPLLKKFGVTHKVENCLTTGKNINFNTTYKSKWGKQSYLKFKIEPLFENNKNEVTGALIIAEDLTEQHDVKKQLTDTENRYLRTLQLIPDTILVFDKEFNVIDFHKPAERECKLFTDEIINNNIKSNTPVDVFNAIKTKTIWVIKNKKPSTFEFKVTVNNEQLSYESRISQIDKNMFMVLIKEVTQQNLTIRKLADREIKLEEASKIAQLGWYEVLGTEGYYYGSIYTHKIFFDEDLGNPITREKLIDVIHPEDRGSFFDTVKTNIENKSEDFSWEYRLITPKGNLKYVWTKTYLNFDEQGNLVSRFGVVQDITETKTTQIALQQSQKSLIEAKNKAEESDQLKSAFLANMSHEIRTPLNAILGFSSLLEIDDYSKDEHNSFIKTINKNGQYLLNIINDIIDFSKIEANQLQLNIEKVNINSLIKETHNLLQKLVPNNVDFLYQLGLDDVESDILTDSQRVSQVLINLVNNAFKFTELGSICIEYYLNELKTDLIFSVSDTGWGIEHSKIPEIFTRFHQLDHIKQGAGLGLSISKGLVTLLGGRIWLESEFEKGSTFYFSLPYRKV